MKVDSQGKWIIFAVGVSAVLVVGWIYRRSIKRGLSYFVSKLKNTALSELEFWKQGNLTENDPSVMERLRMYWNEGAGVKNWGDQQMKDEAWSAAFISYIMKKSGAGEDWKYSPSHSTYITQAIKNRKENVSNPFKGYKPEEVKIEVGDLVGKPREGGVTYDSVGAYKSHTDVVVTIKDGYAESIGGNVANSVVITKVPLTPDGKIDNSKVSGGKYFVVIKNKK
jgi:hypothetical protein